MVNSGAKVLQKNGICKFCIQKKQHTKKQSALFDGLFLEKSILLFN